MTDLRTAAQQALEALQELNGWQSLAPPAASSAAVQAAINLSAALAEPVQEPVAWRWGYRSVTTGEMDWRGYVEIAAHPNLRSPEIIMEPLYTSPPQRKPLTEEEMEFMWEADTTSAEDCQSLYYFKVVARAIERAHGIGEQQ